MKILTAVLVILLPALSARSEEPQESPAGWSTNEVQRQTNSVRPVQKNRIVDEDEKRQKRHAREGRRLQFMERELRNIGITDEEKARVSELQQQHKQKMSANAERIAAAREALSRLMDEGASMEALEAAIDKIAAAQAEQLRILVYNRIEMERILGKEKYELFMNNARKQFQKHGRRGGAPLPPRPGIPPVPGRPAADPAPPATPAP
jgi:hypothetical protein